MLKLNPSNYGQFQYFYKIKYQGIQLGAALPFENEFKEAAKATAEQLGLNLVRLDYNNLFQTGDIFVKSYKPIDTELFDRTFTKNINEIWGWFNVDWRRYRAELVSAESVTEQEAKGVGLIESLLGKIESFFKWGMVLGGAYLIYKTYKLIKK